MNNVSDMFAAHVERTTFENLDTSDINWAKQRIADSIGVLLAGAHGLGNDKIRELICEWGGAKESSMLVFGGKVPAHNAAWINSFMIRSYDFEVIDAEVEGSKTLPAHITGTTVPVMFSMGEYVKASGKDLITALILADDLAARLISAVGFGLYDCFDGNGTANSMGATTVAAKLLHLNKEQIRNAYALDLNMCGGTMENVFQGTWAFKLPIALSARNGIIAAEMAKKGLSGVRDPFGGTRCYFDMFSSDNPRTEVFLNNLGQKYYSDVVIKPWPSCHGTQYALDAGLEITKGIPCSPDDVKAVVVRVSPAQKGFVGQDFDFGVTDQPAGAFSIRFTLATAILRGNLRPEHYSSKMMLDPELGKMLSKIEIVENGPKKGAIVEIHFTDGTSISNEVNESLGHTLKKPLSDDQIFDKFIKNVTFSNTIDRARAEEAFELSLKLDDMESLEPIIKLITPA